MRRKPSVLIRALISNVALGALVVLALTALLMGLLRGSFRQQLELRAGEMAEFVAAQSQYPLLVADRAALEQMAASALRSEDVLAVVIAENGGGEPIALTRKGGAEPGHSIEVERPVAAPGGSAFLGFDRGGSAPQPLGRVRVWFSTAKQDALFRRIAWSAAGLAVLVLAAAIPLQFLDLRRVLSPLAELSRFAGRVGEGGLRERAAVMRADEIGDLTVAFNQMLDRLSSTTVSRDYVDNIIRCMAESLIVVGIDGRIRTVNQATLDLLGCGEPDLVNRPANQVCGAAGLGDGRQETGTAEYRHREGRQIPVLLSRAPLRGADGELSGEVWMAQDMTERQRAERELLEAKEAAESANRAKSLFLATMSHELRTPLNAVLGFAQLLQVEMEEQGMDQWNQDLQKIERSGQMLLGLINNILDLSKIDAGRMEISTGPVEMAAIVEDAAEGLESLVTRNGNRITVVAAPARVMGDALRIRQCLVNLIGNACKFTREGRITVEGSIGPGLDGECYRVRVADTGIGIEPADLARLFADFTQVEASTTRKYGGSGLGLAISRRFARLMGGDVTAESTAGQGATFTLELPLAEAQQPKLLEELETIGR